MHVICGELFIKPGDLYCTVAELQSDSDMKILIVHNYYNSYLPSGESTAVEADVRLLLDHGFEVINYTRHNEEIDERGVGGRLTTAMASVWSQRTYADLTRLIAEQKPDVAHFHNLFPLISTSGYVACRRAGVPVVQTVHNYRLSCLNGLFMRDGAVCEDCLGKSSLRGIFHRCYRDSLAASLVAAGVRDAEQYILHNVDKVDIFIALTEFSATKLIAGGIAKERIVIRSNFIEQDYPPVTEPRGDFVLYAGRLAPEKGVRTLIKAWQGIRNVQLVIAGEGPQRLELEALVQSLEVNARFVGLRTRDDVLKLAGQARCQIVPSEWYEGFPMTIVEAFSRGTPVIAARIGGLPEIVERNGAGVMFPPSDSEALNAVARGLLENQTAWRTYSDAAWHAYLHKYSRQPAMETLEAIYKRIV